MYRLLFTAVVTLALVGSAWSQTPTAADADFDGDGEVQFGDFLLFTVKFNTRQGDGEYEARYDLDSDGAVNFSDFLLFVGVFGQTVPSSPPVAHAGEDQSVDKRETVTLDGSNSKDPAGRALTFAWRQVAGDSISLSSAGVAQPTFRTQVPGNYAFQLVVHNGVVASEPDTVGVEVVAIAEMAVKVGSPDAGFMYKEMTGNQLTFSVQNGAPPVEVGAVMVNTVEPYFLKKVTRVVNQNASEVVVMTEDAALTDVIEDAQIRRTFRLPATKIMATDEEKKDFKVDKDLTVSWGITTDFDFVFDADIYRFKLKSVEAGISNELRAYVEIALNAKAEYTNDVEKIVGEIGKDIVFSVGWVPVLIEVKVELSVGANVALTAKGNITQGVEMTKPFHFVGVKYDGENWGVVKDIGPFEVNPINTISAGVGATMRGYVRGQLEFNLYKVAGPYCYLEPYIQFDAIAAAAVDETVEVEKGWALYAGLDGGVGVKAGIIEKITGGKETLDKAWPFNFARVFVAGNQKLKTNPGNDLNIEDAVFSGITADVANNRFYVTSISSNGEMHVFDYKSDVGSAETPWQRDESASFDLDVIPLGITYDDTYEYLWMVVYDYDMNTNDDMKYQMRRYHKNGQKLGPTVVLLDSNPVHGITYADGKLYVVDGGKEDTSGDEKVRVYGHNDYPGRSNELVEARILSTHSIASTNTNPSGITYANNRFYVVDGGEAGQVGEAKVYVYDSDWKRVPDSDFHLSLANSAPSGITYANNRFYVVDYDDDTIYEYGQPDLLVESFSVSDSTLTAGKEFSLQAFVRNQGIAQAASTTLRYYRSTDETIRGTAVGPKDGIGIDSLNGADRSSAKSIRLDAPSDPGTYYYRACVNKVIGEDESDTDNNCSDAVRVRVVFGGMPSSSGISAMRLDSDNNFPTGITYADSLFYVVDADSTVYVYKWPKKESIRSFDLDGNNGTPTGITYADNRLYVTDSGDKVYAYNSSGPRYPTFDFVLSSPFHSFSHGITYDNDRFYVVHLGDAQYRSGAKVYVYNNSGTSLSLFDFPLDGDNILPVGITYAKDRFYVVDGEYEKVYVYDRSSLPSGQRYPTLDFVLHSHNTAPAGITYANGYFYVVDWGKAQIFRYPDFAIPDLTVESSVQERYRTLAPGDTLRLRARVENVGKVPADSTTLRYYLSGDSSITQDDTEQGTDAVGVLAPPGTSTSHAITTTMSITLTAPSTRGTYFYGACVDSVRDESNTDNNCSDAVSVVVTDGSGISNIPDANLRAVIADSLGKTSGEAITSAEMATLTRLDAPDRGIRDLTGLEQAINLTGLNLGSASVNDAFLNSNAISDLSPLSNLTNLTELDLDRNSISNISPLSGLTRLTELDIGFNSISDVSALSGMTSLEALGLGFNSISDVSVLSGMTSLEVLDLSGNSISDVSVLSGLTSLEVLNLSGNSITDVSALSGLTRLRELSLALNSISDVSSLSGLTRLTWLSLDGNSISDVSALSGMTSLDVLGLGENSISDVSALSGLTRLRWLNLISNSISDVSVLSRMTDLQVLSLGGNSITDVSSLSGLTLLIYLDLSANSISDVSALSGMTSLAQLNLLDNAISNLAPLVANMGLGSGDLVDVRRNPLSATSINTHIPALYARGVTVFYGAFKPAVGVGEMPMPRAAINMFENDALERDGSISLWRMADKDR